MLYRVMSLMVSNRYLNLGNSLCVNGSTRENASLKILILSCNTGSGHNSAAAAIAEYAKTQGATCDIMDALAFTSEHFSKMISNGHSFVYRNMPRAFGWGYQVEEKEDLRFIDFFKRFGSIGAKRLYRYINLKQYDAVVSVHVFASLMLSCVKHKYGPLPPYYFVATDYTCSPGVSRAQADIYFVPHEKTIPEFIHYGIPAERLVVTGIPISQRFFEKQQKAVSRKNLGLPEKGRMVLFACGSIGCGPIPQITQILSDKLPQDDYVTVVCGHNEKLYKHMQAQHYPSNVVLVGYTDQMPLYLDSADLFLSKAGGLSTTEALAKRVPLVYMNTIPGCEKHNFDFMLQNGYAFTGEIPNGLCSQVCALLQDPQTLEQLIEKYENECNNNGAKNICNYIFSHAATMKSQC